MLARKFHVALVIALSVLVAAAAFAQTSTTGAIEGRVTDRSGASLPGVTVEIRSQSLQGTKTDVSDAGGRFRFGLLPPGTYSLTATLTGFSSTQEQAIVVGLSRTVTLVVSLSPAMTERITVTAAAPIVDVKSTTTGENITTKMMQSLPMGRNFIIF